MVIDDTMSVYLQTRDINLRNQLVDKHLWVVEQCARKLISKISWLIEYDDLIQEGAIGLIKALETYDPSHNVSFASYSQKRAFACMLDKVRKINWAFKNISRNAMKLSIAEGLFYSKRGHNPTTRELARSMGMRMTKLRRMIRCTPPRVVNLKIRSTENDMDLAVSKRIGPLDAACSKDMYEYMVCDLNPREKLICAMMCEGYMQTEIRCHVGLSLARTQIIKNNMVDKLTRRARILGVIKC